MTFDYSACYNEAVRLIQGFEGCRLEAYQDPAGVWTLGYGLTAILGRPVKEGDTCTAQQAAQWLGMRVGACVHYVQAQVRYPLTTNEVAALASFVYNVGDEAFHDSTLHKLLNEGKIQEAAGEFDKWCHATVNGKLVVLAGLLHRREVEKQEFLT